ncbi:MAG: hypothetical protein SFU85_08465 [Candidatus Methylacidiphilales bacterium]|nr:hypothetical protein [Candidatus Methylacidiphilales bacterium]
MNIFNSCLNPIRVCLLLSAILMLVGISACAKKGPDMMGEWVPVPEANHFRVKAIRFESDGSFYFDQTAGKWEIKEGNKITLIFPNVLPNTYEFEFSKEGKLILKDQAGIAGEFTRPGRVGI